VQKQKSKVLI